MSPVPGHTRRTLRRSPLPCRGPRCGRGRCASTAASIALHAVRPVLPAGGHSPAPSAAPVWWGSSHAKVRRVLHAHSQKQSCVPLQRYLSLHPRRHLRHQLPGDHWGRPCGAAVGDCHWLPCWRKFCRWLLWSLRTLPGWWLCGCLWWCPWYHSQLSLEWLWLQCRWRRHGRLWLSWWPWLWCCDTGASQSRQGWWW